VVAEMGQRNMSARASIDMTSVSTPGCANPVASRLLNYFQNRSSSGRGEFSMANSHTRHICEFYIAYCGMRSITRAMLSACVSRVRFVARSPNRASCSFSPVDMTVASTSWARVRKY
jgi:hypothetical protein